MLVGSSATVTKHVVLQRVDIGEMKGRARGKNSGRIHPRRARLPVLSRYGVSFMKPVAAIRRLSLVALIGVLPPSVIAAQAAPEQAHQAFLSLKAAGNPIKGYSALVTH